MAKMTVREISSLKPKPKQYVVRVEPGLYMRVATNGIKRWFVRFSINSKQKDAILPEPFSLNKQTGYLTLAEAREKKAQILSLARDGIDFRIKEEEEKEAALAQKTITDLTVSDLFETWLADGVSRQDGNAELERLFSKDILPVIGSMAVNKLTDADILTTLRKMLSRGVSRLTVSAFNDLTQMFAWAEKRKPWRALLSDGNPCDLIEINKLLPHDYEEERDRILLPEEIQELSSIFKKMQLEYINAPNRRATCHPVTVKTQIALWLCLSTICRIGELLMARWEHVDFENKVWYIPREAVKGTRTKKQEHYVFLSDFALRKFEALHKISGESEYCFPSRNKKGEQTHVCVKSVSKQIGDRQIQFKNRENRLKNRAYDNSLVLADGLRGDWTPHDMRRTGATMMQQLGISLDVIDRCQNHILAGSRVRRHYLHHDYKKEKTEAWDKLGKRLEEILSQ